MDALTIDCAFVYQALWVDGIGLQLANSEAEVHNLALTLYPGNSQILQLDGLYDQTSDTYPTTATLTATLEDASGSPVSGLQDLALAYVDETPSSYATTINGADFDPEPGAYTLTVSGTNGGSAIELQIPVTVEAREG